MEQLAVFTREILPDGALESLAVDGVIAGVGNVVVFLPQIMLLFFSSRSSKIPDTWPARFSCSTGS